MKQSQYRIIHFQTKMSVMRLLALSLLMACIVTVNCRGGVGGGGGSSEGPSVLTIFFVVISIGVVCCGSCCWCFYDFKGSTKECYLCLNRVANRDWDSGDHRRQCASTNSTELDNMPKHPTQRCPKCDSPLRLWPTSGAGGDAGVADGERLRAVLHVLGQPCRLGHGRSDDD